MKSKIALGLALVGGLIFTGFTTINPQNSNTKNEEVPTQFHDLKVNALDGDSVLNMSDYKGKYVLLVNVASKCGYTKQYAELQKLYASYGKRLTIIGLPSNQFGNQEPGSNEEIRTFCSESYGVTFPIAEKIKVKGDDIHPVYQWLTSKELNGVDDYKVTWNFCKFLISPEGKLLGYYNSKTVPFDPSITDLIK